MSLKSKLVKPDKWQTLESYWNAKGTVFFLEPKNARVRVRYGGSSWWNGYTGQEKTLDGIKTMKISIGIGSILYARLQIAVKVDSNVTYDVYPGSVAVQSPECSF